MVEGFDPPQRPILEQRHYDDFVADLSQPSNPVLLNTELENQGYDLIYIDFHNGGDYIQRSAYLVEEIITWVNAQKTANGSIEPNVVLGVSNGGLISRYALREMEMMGIPHDTRQYIAFDSPQQGANVPLGYQLMVLDIANMEIYGHNLDLMYPELHTAVEVLNNPAARQVLVYHGTSPNQATAERTTLMNWFSQNGYPAQCELVVVSNGSNNGTGEPFAPGDIMLRIFKVSDFLPYDFRVYALPDHAVQDIYTGILQIRVGPILVYGLNSVATATAIVQPYDSAPGGLLSLEAMGVDFSFVDAEVVPYEETFCFVPTVSALDLAAPFNQDLYVNVQSLGIIANNRTPFDSYWASIQLFPPTGQLNEPHVFFTPGNVNFFRNLWVGSNSLPTVNSFPLLQNINYNYGRNSAQFTTNAVSTGFTIGNGSTVSVNANQNLGLPTDNLAPPATGSHFNVYVGNAGCSSVPIVVDVSNNGVLSLGDINGNSGNVYFGAGTTLIIRNGGKLIVHDNSRVIIEEGASIIFEDGAQIQLLGDNAVLDIKGILEIGANATFTFTYPNANSGYVRFSRASWVPYEPSAADYQIIAGTGSSMEFVGINNNDKVLEIAQSSLFIPGALDHFTVHHAKVAFAGNQNQYPVLSIGCPIVTLTLSRFAREPNTNGGNGVVLYGQPNHVISGCTFENLNAGLIANNFYGIGMLNLFSCRFTQCGTGLVVVDKGVILKSCRFDNCYVGAELNGLTFNSTITNCKFNDNYHEGLSVKGSPIEVVMNNCEARRNQTAGVDAAGVTMNLACCDLRNNGVYAMIIDYDASLRMSPIFNGGNNNLGGNQIPIILNEANQIEISGGRNLLTPQSSPNCNGNGDCPNVFVGTIQAPSCVFTIDARNNQWKNNTTNYNTTWNSQSFFDLPVSRNSVFPVVSPPCTNNLMVRFSDPNQMSYQQCPNTPNGPPGGGGGPPNQNLSPLNNCANCNSINTASFSNTQTDAATRMAISNMDSTLANGYSDAVGMFNEILMYPLANETDGDKYVKKASARKMHEALGEGIYRSQISYSSTVLSQEATEVIQAEADEKDKGDQSGDYHRMFFAAMREAAAYRASGKRDAALQKFEEILTWVQTAERPWTEYWICLTSHELDVLENGSLKETFIDDVQECLPLHLTASSLRLATSEDESDIVSETALDATLYPNPVSEVLTIDVFGSDNSLVTFELYSATGQLVQSEIITGGVQKQINVSDLQAGLYFYRLIGEGDKTKEGRLVITH